MEVCFFQAECGDAARIRYLGNDNKYHNILIDSGYERTFRHVLEEVIKDISSKGEKIDLWIISHIHDDHIGGIMQYISAIQDGEYKDIVQQYFYNPPRENQISSQVENPISTIMGIDQGDSLYAYLKSIDKLQPKDIVSSVESLDLFGLKMTILSPSTAKLKKLRKKYSKPEKALEREEDEEISTAVAPRENDYHFKLEEFDLKTWKQDDSVENGSSISVLTEFKNKKILWLADSHPNDVTKTLEDLGYSKTNKINCELVKVTHHGSKGNNSSKLFSMIDCQNYIFSVDGINRHKLPNKECIARLLRDSHRNMEKKYELSFTYDNSTLRSIFENDEETYSKLNFEVTFSNQKELHFPLK